MLEDLHNEIIESVMKELRKNMLEYIRLLQSLIQLLTGDAQTYNVISSGLTSQLPVASREQFATTDSSYVFDSSHGSEFDQTTLGSTKSPAAKNRTGSKSESLFASESKLRLLRAKTTKKKLLRDQAM